LLAATGASVFDLSVFSLVGAFGALAIGTNQAITHYGASFAFVVASVLFALIYLLILADGIYAIVRAW
jgi:hypothetical protein